VSAAADWRIGEPAPARALPKRSWRDREILVPGEVVVRYIGQDGCLLGVLARRAMFPVRTDRVRSDVSGRKITFTFPACGTVDGQAFESQVRWFTTDAAEYARASASERAAAIWESGLTPRAVLECRLFPLPEPKPAGASGKRRIDYGNGRSAIVTDGEAKRIDFDDGESVTVTELPEGGAIAGPPRKKAPRYLVPERFTLEIHDEAGLRIGLTTGTRYREQDAMREDDR
jgi:hypothetical protein